MSAIAMNLYDRLREGGIPDEAAREIVEIFDAKVSEALRDAEKHADRAADKVRAESVPADEYHKRMENTPTRAESESQFAKVNSQFDRVDSQFDRVWDAINDLRREMREGFTSTNRLVYGVLLAIFLLLLKDIAGL